MKTHITVVVCLTLSQFANSQGAVDYECRAAVGAPTENETELSQVYDQFESSVASGDGDGLLATFLYDDVPIHIIERTDSGPVSYSPRSGTGMANYIATNTDNYELRISNTEFHLLGNFAYSIADFDEYIQGRLEGSGKDLFMYLNSANGWKLVVLSNSFTYEVANFDYGDGWNMSRQVEQTLTELQTAINTQNSALFASLFVNDYAIYSSLNQNLCDGSFSTTEHSAGAFYNWTTGFNPTPNLTISNSDIQIYDDFLATAVTEYQKSVSGEVFESGQQIITLISDAQSRWVITGVYEHPDFVNESIALTPTSNQNPSTDTVVVSQTPGTSQSGDSSGGGSMGIWFIVLSLLLTGKLKTRKNTQL
jgi:hypothetical protein